MKSRLFRRFDPKDVSDNRFAEDVSLVISLTPAQWSAVVSALPALAAAQTLAERRPVFVALEESTGIPPTALSRICEQAKFFLGAFHTEDLRDEDPALWVEDLVATGLLAPEQEDKMVAFLRTLREQVLLEIEALHRQRLAEVGVMPAFEGASTTVELRGVFKKEYSWGEPVEDFAPELDTTTPVVSVAIKVDSGTPDTFVFQASPSDLDYLISELTAAKKSAGVLQRLGRES